MPIANVFSLPYVREQWLNTLAEILSVDKLLQPVATADAKVKRLGTIQLADNKQLAILEIDTDTQLHRNRVGLRQLAVKQLHTEDGALAVYLDKNQAQWRLSFIAIQYVLDDKGKIKPQQTASRRYTYLLGKGRQTRTVMDRFSHLNPQSTLNDLEQAFAVEPLNKEFYGKLYNWYLRAQNQATFPNDMQQDNHSQASLIRLLTRLLFIWFLKEKKLINPDLFDATQLQNIIAYDKPNSFYKAILQNLFFATLNRPITDRSFRTTTNGSANGTNYLATNIYRYQDYFQQPDAPTIIALFNTTPFLNGGLFECLDREASEEEKQEYDQNNSIRQIKSAIRIDGFSDRPDNQLALANSLFFKEDEADLGLITLFQQYQFTVEESTPADIAVALDPELLGKVFENLLATYNPETSEQTRKTTGSFYTPREIVSYMVDESLKQHLEQHTDLTQHELENLFIEKESNLTNTQIKTLITAIDRLKILDPAVGSGAFPMGILQRLVFILEKIDPENTHFKHQQLDKAEKIPDETSRNSAIKAIEQVFSSQNQHNAYGKKLMLIENAIYGVDIQAIAIQICKLRFFISLTIEQKPNTDKNDNYGIKALPNLETKFIVANSLLPLGEIELPQLELFDQSIEIKELQRQLAEVRHRYFSAKTLGTKRKYRDMDKELREKMLAILIKSGSGINPEVETSMRKVVDWDLYNPNAISDWFDPKWQFGVKDGFDIVLGNPPYIRHESIKKQVKPKLKEHYQVFTGAADIYTYFYEKGFILLSEQGHLCYITSNKWMRAKYGEKLRFFFKNTAHLKQIIDFAGKQIFENATVDTNILLCGKAAGTGKKFGYANVLPTDKQPLSTMLIADLSPNAYILQPPEILTLKKKIEAVGTPLNEWDINIYFGIKTGFNPAFIIDKETRDRLCNEDPKSDEILKPILRGRDIKRYRADRQDLWLIDTHNGYNDVPHISIDEYQAVKRHLDKYYPQLDLRQDKGITSYNLRSCAYHAEFEKEKIVWKRIGSILRFSYHRDKTYCLDSTCIATGSSIKFLCAFLNSKLAKYLLQYSPKTGTGDLIISVQALTPIYVPKLNDSEQQPFIALVDKILPAKQQNQDTSDLENQIDQLVYNLYNLTNNEIHLIENHG